MIDKNTDFFAFVDSFAKYKSVPSNLISGKEKEIPCKVTIAIPTYKRPDLLKSAIDSALNQIQYNDFDVIVVDNDPVRECETEKLLSTYSNPRLRYYKNSDNIGMFGNMNRCFELANSEWILILHDDDFLSPGFLVEMCNIISKNPGIEFLNAKYYLWEYNGTIYQKHRPRFFERFEGGINKLTIQDYHLFFPTRAIGSLLKRKNVLALGGFNEEFYPTSDYVFTTNYCSKYNTYNYNKYLYNYRVGQNESSNPITLGAFFTNDFFLQNAIGNLIGRKNKFWRNVLKERVRFRVNISKIDIDRNFIYTTLDIDKKSRLIYCYMRLLPGIFTISERLNFLFSKLHH